MMSDAFMRLVDDFGRRLGLSGLAPGANGVVEMTIERLGRLQLEPAGEGVLISLARPWPEYAASTALAALEQCHWRENHPWPIHPGAKGGEWLVFTASAPARELDPPLLERIIGYLADLLDRTERAK